MKLRREVEQEVGELRHQVTLLTTTSQAAATANPTLIVDQRRQDTYDALNDARDSGVAATQPVGSEAVGGYALTAFKAAMLGLPQQLPEWGRAARVVGFRREADGSLSFRAQSAPDAFTSELLDELMTAADPFVRAPRSARPWGRSTR